jgi:hypothetical protein
MDRRDEGPYLEVKMPERFLLHFQLEDGGWMDEAVCPRRRFERLDNSSYISRSSAPDSGFAASPIMAITSSM